MRSQSVCVVVGAMLIAAPETGSAAQRSDRIDVLRQIATDVGRLSSAASVCREISWPRIKALTDQFSELIKASVTNGEEFSSIQRAHDQSTIEGQLTASSKHTNCAAAVRDLADLERAVTSQPPAAVATGTSPAQMWAATVASPPPARTSTGAGAPQDIASADPLEDGVTAYQQGDFATALRLFGPLAEQGDASAQTNLGVMYEQGRGVAQNYREAMKWFRLAALQGNASAQSNLGVMYYRGQGIAQDYREAMKWYRLGAEQGNAEAMFNLGVMYEQGRGVGQDYARAYIWYNLAASQSSDENAKLAIKARDIIARRLEPAQLLRAQDMARRCEVSSLKNCDRADP
jgi:hypothetical protein